MDLKEYQLRNQLCSYNLLWVGAICQFLVPRQRPARGRKWSPRQVRWQQPCSKWYVCDLRRGGGGVGCGGEGLLLPRCCAEMKMISCTITVPPRAQCTCEHCDRAGSTQSVPTQWKPRGPTHCNNPPHTHMHIYSHTYTHQQT